MKKIGKMLLSTLCMLSLAACGTTNDNTTTALSGKISMNGSTSMEKVVNALAEAFIQKYPEVTIEPQFTGSSAGIEAVSKGTSDIGNCSRELKDSEKKEGIVENIIAIDGIAVIVSNDQEVSQLTKEQLADIYTGKITNWKDVGGIDQPIVVIGREAASGTRSAFEELLQVKDVCQYAQEVDSTGGVVAKVQETQGAIGYVSLDVLDGQVKALALDGVEANESNIKNGTYALSRPFVMATKGSLEQQNEKVKAFFEFVQSDEGQAIIQSVGLITVG